MKRLCLLLLFASLSINGATAQNVDDYVSATLEAGKTEVYVGEPFEISLIIRSHSVTLDQDFTMDPFKDPAIKQLPRDTGQYPIERRVVNNRIEEIRKFSWSAVGVATGVVEISNTLELAILSRDTRLFLSRPKRTPFSIPVKGATINIRPLPETGRPASFSGAVGRFSLTVDVTPKAAAPGDVLRIRSEVRGSGLLDKVGPPLLSSVDDLKVYDPRRLPNSSTLIFEQQVVPQSTSALTVPELTFSYFDPDRGVYETLRAGPFSIAFRERPEGDDETFRPEDEGIPSARRASYPLLSHLTLGLSICAAFMLAAIVMALRRNRRRSAILAGCLGVVLAMAAVGHAVLRKPMRSRKNMFRLESRQIGMIAPSAASPRTLTIPSGAYVELITCREGWAMVGHDGRQCWIPESELGPIEKSSEK